MDEKTRVRICVPVCVQHVSDIAPSMNRAAELAEIIELRLDCLTQAEFHDIEHDLAKFFKESVRPVIFTFRPAEQGGRRELDQRTRMGFWLPQCGKLLRDNESYADLEVDVGQGLSQFEQYFNEPDWDRVICSYHDFLTVPTNLEEIYQRMLATKAHILKIAVQADEITDCLPVLQLLERARSEGREMIAIAIGEAGVLTRILGPSRGAFLTYGSLDDAQTTAPGQISAADLEDLYRVRNINDQTEIMGLVGQPVMHSVSPQIHNSAFAATDYNAVYIPFEVRDLDGFVRRMVDPRTRELEWNLRGLSITAPHKTAIMRCLDWIDPPATEIGAVNSIVVSGDGLYGYNTDATAVLAPMEGLIELNKARVAVIGAGGAARSLLWSLRKAGAHVTVFARDVEKVRVTARQFDAECTTLANAAFGEFDVVVNTTPLGTRGLSEDATPAIASQLRGARIAYDIVYNPIETRFMREAREAGCHTVGGLHMLVAQAAEQFKLWTGNDAPKEIMHDAALKALMK